MNLYAGRGVAAREYPLTWGSADYLLFVDRQAVGVIEAKKEGVTLTGVELQAEKLLPERRRGSHEFESLIGGSALL